MSVEGHSRSTSGTRRPDGPAPLRMCRQQQSGELRPHERRRMGRCSADAVVSRLPSSSRATGVLVSGVDHDGQRSADSIPGASWIFPLSSLDRLGAFIAVRMNGEPVPLDHGRPLRLVVPGLVRMRVDQVGERGSPGRSRRARDEPDERVRGANPSDPPARPRQGIRASRHPDCSYASSRREATRPRWPRIPYRRHRLGRHEACGSPRDSFRRERTPGEPLSDLSRAPDSAVWALWEYRWKPETTGLYSIGLRVPDTSVPQRRLDERLLHAAGQNR